MPSDISRLLATESHTRQQPRHIGSKSIRVRIEALCSGSEFVLIERGARLETIEPDIIRAQVASQAVTDDRGNLSDLLRAYQCAEEAVQFAGGNLHTFLKVSLNTCRCRRTEAIFLKQSVRNSQYPLITRVGFGCIIGAVWLPYIIGTVDRPGRDRLIDNTLHDAVNHFLLFLPALFVGIERLEFVAQVPMAEQHFVVRPELPAVLGAQVTHIDIVVGYIVLGIGIGLRQLCIDGSRHTRSEHITHTRHCPLQARPRTSHSIFLIQRVMREVQNGDKGEFVGKHIIGKMCHGTICRHDIISRSRLAGISQLCRLEQINGKHVG